jgi:hypothetical protein
LESWATPGYPPPPAVRPRLAGTGAAVTVGPGSVCPGVPGQSGAGDPGPVTSRKVAGSTLTLAMGAGSGAGCPAGARAHTPQAGQVHRSGRPRTATGGMEQRQGVFIGSILRVKVG